MTEPIGGRDFHDALFAAGWRIVSEGACAHYRTSSIAESAAFVQAIAGVAGVDGHPPDIDIRPGGVTVRLLTVTDDHYGQTTTDLELGRRISAIAGELGLTTDPAAIQSLLVIVGAPAPADVMPFWEAVLGYERRPDSPDEDLVDPRSRGPAFWFETMDEPSPGGRGAVHVGIWLPPDEADARVAAAVAAGGRVVREIHLEPAPGYGYGWRTLADPVGNEADISAPDRPA